MRQPQKFRIWNSEANQFIKDPGAYTLIDTGDIWRNCDWHVQEHLHALRTCEVNEVEYTEYDMIEGGNAIILYIKGCMYLVRNAHKFPLAEYCGNEKPVSALEHVGKLNRHIAHVYSVVHPLLSQAIKRYEALKEMGKHLRECAAMQRLPRLRCSDAPYIPGACRPLQRECPYGHAACANYTPRCENYKPPAERITITSIDATRSFAIANIVDTRKCSICGNKNSILITMQEQSGLSNLGLQFESKTECDRQLKRLKDAID